MRAVNFSEARNNLKEVLDRVVDVTLIRRRDAGDVVVMSLDTWNSWRETEYLLASPANARHLAKSIAQLNAGKGVERELIDPSALRVQEPRARYGAKAASKKKAPPRKRAKNMAGRIVFGPEVWADYLYGQSQDRRTLDRINLPIRECQRDPFRASKPEPLKRECSGAGRAASTMRTA